MTILKIRYFDVDPFISIDEGVGDLIKISNIQKEESRIKKLN